MAVVTVDASGATYDTLTVTSEAGTAVGDSKVKVVASSLDNGEKLYYKDLGAGSAPAYLAAFNSTGWTAIANNTAVNISGLTGSNTLTVVGVNGTGQVVAKGTATIVVKTL